MKLEVYLSELTAQLQCRGVGDDEIVGIIAEVETHLVESDESPVDAFGPAAQYAEKMAVFAENRTTTEPTASTASTKPTEQWHHRTFRATALDEMGTLKWAGEEGWELVDVGAWALFCRRPVDMTRANRWEYKRRTGTHRRIIAEEMASGEWEPCGNWIVFHYFKRKVGTVG